MQRTDNIKYLTVKCYNPPTNYKNIVQFENSFINDKTKLSNNTNTNPNQQQQFNHQNTKIMRIHTEGSEPHYLR